MSRRASAFGPLGSGFGSDPGGDHVGWAPPSASSPPVVGSWTVSPVSRSNRPLWSGQSTSAALQAADGQRRRHVRTAVLGGEDPLGHVRQEEVQVPARDPHHRPRGQRRDREHGFVRRADGTGRGERRRRRGDGAHSAASVPLGAPAGPGAPAVAGRPLTGPSDVRSGSSRMAMTATKAMAAAMTPSQKTEAMANEIAS